jgi:hypothetical protein
MQLATRRRETTASKLGKRAGDGAVVALYALTSRPQPLTMRVARALLVRHHIRRAIRRRDLQRRRQRVDALILTGVLGGLTVANALRRKRAHEAEAA